VRQDGSNIVDIGMAFNHSVADGTSSLRLIRDVCAALDCALRADGDTSTLWPGPPMAVPPASASVLFGEGNPDVSWLEFVILWLLALALKLIPQVIFKPDIPNVRAKTPFVTAMAWGDACTADQWRSLLAACKTHGVKPQAAMDAAALFLTASVIAQRNGSVGTSKPIHTELVMPVTMRSADRVLPGRQHFSDADVGFTIAFAKFDVSVAADDTFWPVAKRIQAEIDKQLTPKSLRFTTLMFSYMMSWMIAHPEHAAVLATFDPINLGRNVSDLQFALVKAVGCHLGQKSIPMVAPAFGYVWPFESNGTCSFSLEFEAQLWTKEEGLALLNVFTAVLFNPPQETFAQFSARLRDQSRPESLLSKLKR
jgi:hypothetical protein